MSWAAWYRQRALLAYTLGSMRRRLWRNAGLAAALTAVVFTAGSIVLLSEALLVTASRDLQGAPEVTLQRLELGRHALAGDEAVAAAAAVRGVQSAEGRLWGYFYDGLAEATYTLRVAPTGSPAAAPAGKVRVGSGVARRRGLKAGDVFFLAAPGYETLVLPIQDVFLVSDDVVAADLVVLAEQDFRRFFGLEPGRWTDVAVTVRNPDEVDTVVAKLLQELPRYRARTRQDLLRSYAAAYDWRQGFLLAPLAIALLAFGLLIWDRAAGLSGDEVREVGVLRGLGWSVRDVLASKAWEGAVLLGIGTGVGYLAAFWHVHAQGAPWLASALAGWSGLRPELRLARQVAPSEVVVLGLLVGVPYLLATLVPVWRSAISDPDEVLR